MRINSPRYTAAVALHLATKLHAAKPGTRCRCGQCRHLIAVTAARAGIPPAQLLAALPPEAKPEKERRRGARQRLTSQVGVSLTVSRDGQRDDGQAALLALLGR